MFEALVKAIQGSVIPKIVKVAEEEYISHPVYLPPEPSPEPLEVSTLEALVRLTKADEWVRESDKLIHVVSPTQVDLISELEGRTLKRWCFATAKYKHQRFDFGDWMEPEQFAIFCLSRFAELGDRAAVLRVSGSLVEENSIQTDDTGITQKVTVRQGVLAKEENIKPIVTLAPMRTFSEVPQVPSHFLFRIRKGNNGVRLSLTEADGGAWKVQAIAEIAKYLEDKTDLPIVY